MPKKKPKYWTWWHGMYSNPCSVHTTEEAARRHARKCQESGGTKHTIYKVEDLGDVDIHKPNKHRTRRKGS